MLPVLECLIEDYHWKQFELGIVSFTSLFLPVYCLDSFGKAARIVCQDGCLHSVGFTVVEELHLQTETDCKFIPNDFSNIKSKYAYSTKM